MPPCTSKPSFTCGFVPIIGRPSVGKSTFINTVCGYHTAITSPYPQTTRTVIRGIVTTDNFQIVFLDSPGIHASPAVLNTHLNDRAVSALDNADAVLYMLDATRPPGAEEQSIRTMLNKRVITKKIPLIIALNKCDAKQSPNISPVRAYFPDTAIYEISAQEKIGVDEILTNIAATLPNHPPFYPDDYYTDQDAAFRICEQVRGAALEYLTHELPHALYTRMLESSVKHTDEHGAPKHVFARVELVVETPGQRGIVIGKKGRMIRAIRLSALKRLKDLLPYAIQLELRVRDKKKWRTNKAILNHL